ncbi:hypothetical protein [Nonomuraea soli]|uniref:Uncharacterized protein n=1 Tax=Nonomuraea soli TaxID=1032476 RepID=A0A7W0CT25_9ACTN|nr:hypothetical protein [Nonomuraea soli]MBA2896807.1 hypothetical protein [Nonomuraea soli]
MVIVAGPTTCGAIRSGIVWSQNDVDGFTGLLTDEVSLVNFTGIRLRGRAQVKEVMARAVRTPLKDVLTTNELLGVTFPRPDVALASLVKHVNDGRKGALTFVGEGGGALADRAGPDHVDGGGMRTR